MVANQRVVPVEPTYVDDDFFAKPPVSTIYNEEMIPDLDVIGMNRTVQLQLVIGNFITDHVKHFKLFQSTKTHHHFTIDLHYDSINGERENHWLEKGQNFLGKRATVIFKYKGLEDGPERVFVGVITEVDFIQEHGGLGDLRLTGYSPTILLDGAPHTQSFGGGDRHISLASIAEEVIRQGLDNNFYDFRVHTKFGNLLYSCQYEETHYNYLARLANSYGEQFYYDGEVLHFGKLPDRQPKITLEYGRNISNVKVSMRAQHVQPTFYGYNSELDEELEAASADVKHLSDNEHRYNHNHCS